MRYLTIPKILTTALLPLLTIAHKISLGLARGQHNPPRHGHHRNEWAIWIDGFYPCFYAPMGSVGENPWELNGGWFEIDTTGSDNDGGVEVPADLARGWRSRYLER